MDRLHRPGQIDRAQQPPGRRVVDRRRGARPPLHPLGVVLPGEDLDRVVGRQRDADSVRSRRPLAPARSRDEAHVLRRPLAHPWVAVDREQQPVGIGDHDEVLRLFPDRCERVSQDGCQAAERMLGEALVRLLLVDLERSRPPAGVYAGCGRAPPGVHDRRAETRHRALVLEEALPGRGQLPGSDNGTRRDVDGQPWIAHVVVSVVDGAPGRFQIRRYVAYPTVATRLR